VYLDLALSLLLATDLNHARTMLREDRLPEALREMDAALRESPRNPEIQYEIGELLRELAGKRAARLEQLAPDSPEAKQLLGRSLEAHGNTEAALTAYKAALSKNPRQPGLHYLIGNIHWRDRDFDAAKAEMEAELRLNPQHFAANLRLGQILLAMNRPAPAADHLREALRADGASAEAHREMGKACRLLGLYEDALREFQFVVQHLPQDTSVHAQLASVYRSLGQTDRAKAEMEAQRLALRKPSPATAP
jgi:tetratricopeptide (TPR) repeat protein